MLAGFLYDLQHGFRMLLRKPGFALVAIVTIAFGIGANVSVFAVVNAFLLRPLPVRDVDNVFFALAIQGPDPFGVRAMDFEEWQNARSFEDMALSLVQSANITGEGEPERVATTAMAPNFLPTLGVAPAIGRNFTWEEARGVNPALVVILGHGIWARRYAADPNILSKTLRLNGRDHTIVGVMPRGFDLPLNSELWTPYSLDAVPENQRTAGQHTVVARLRAGVTREQAEEELKSLARSMEEKYPESHAGWSAALLPMRSGLLDDYEERTQVGLVLLLGAVGFFLLIACASLANLVIGQTHGRMHELAVRASLGASRGRLAAQLVTESSILLACGGVAGVLLAAWMTPLLVRLSPVRTSAFADHLLATSIDGRVLGFALLATLVVGLLFGAMPILRLTRADLSALTKGKSARGSLGKGTRTLMDASVASQIALTLVLLVCATLMVASFGRLQNLPLGFDTDGVVTMEMSLPPERYGRLEQRVTFVDGVLQRVRALPGVEVAGVTTNTPLSHFSIDSVYECEGRPRASASEVLLTADRLVTPGYLETIGARLLRGRSITADDRMGTQPVVVISEDMAETCWPGQDALGRRVRRISRVQPNAPWMQIVGIVSSIREDRTAFRRNRPAWYVPFAQNDFPRTLQLVARSEEAPAGLIKAIRHEVWSLDRQQPVGEPVLLGEQVSELVHPDRFVAFLMLTFAAAGLFLAVTGTFGLVTYTTSQRMKEFAIRMALGGQRTDILQMVLRQSVKLALFGIVAGVVGAALASRVLSSFVIQPVSLPLVPIVSAAFVLLLATLLASLMPARRATAADPLMFLRQE